MRPIAKVLLAYTLYALSAPAQSETGAIAIAEFFGIPENAYWATEKYAANLEMTDPESADATRRALHYWNRTEALAIAAREYEKVMTAEEIESFENFANSEPGKMLGEAIRSIPTSQEANDRITSIAQMYEETVPQFLASSVFSKPVDIGHTDAWNAAWEAYGVELMCRYFRSERPEMLERVKRKGACASH